MDHYLQMGDDNVHWISIINSILIVLCLAGLIAHIMSKALKRDITQYEAMRQKQQEKLKNPKKKGKKVTSSNQ
jgi:phosphate/sulfate permease